MAKNCYVKKEITELYISDQLNKLFLNDVSPSDSSLSGYEDNDLNTIKNQHLMKLIQIQRANV